MRTKQSRIYQEALQVLQSLKRTPRRLTDRKRRVRAKEVPAWSDLVLAAAEIEGSGKLLATLGTKFELAAERMAQLDEAGKQVPEINARDLAALTKMAAELRKAFKLAEAAFARLPSELRK